MRGLSIREWMLPLACAAAAASVGAGELMTMFKFRVDGTVFQTQTGGSRHGYALLVLAVLAIVALAIVLGARSRPAALSVAICGAIALGVFLFVDLPDVNQVGQLDEPVLITSEAHPAQGFWLQLAGSVVLLLAGGALASATPAGGETRRTRGRPGPTGADRDQGLFDQDAVPVPRRADHVPRA